MNENPSLDCVGVTVYSQVILPVGLARHLAAVLRSGPEVRFWEVPVGERPSRNISRAVCAQGKSRNAK